MLVAHASAGELSRFATELRAAIAEDRDALEDLMRRGQIDTSATRQTAGWISGKVAELKLCYVMIGSAGSGDSPVGGATARSSPPAARRPHGRWTDGYGW